MSKYKKKKSGEKKSAGREGFDVHGKESAQSG